MLTPPHPPSSYTRIVVAAARAALLRDATEHSGASQTHSVTVGRHSATLTRPTRVGHGHGPRVNDPDATFMSNQNVINTMKGCIQLP